MTELPIVVSDDVVTVGGYTNQVELQLSVGATGQRGSRIFTGPSNPQSLPSDSIYFGGYSSFIQGDLYIMTEGQDAGNIYEWSAGNGEWVKTITKMGIDWDAYFNSPGGYNVIGHSAQNLNYWREAMLTARKGGRARVLCIGTSNTYGWGPSDPATMNWPYLLMQNLEAQTGIRTVWGPEPLNKFSCTITHKRPYITVGTGWSITTYAYVADNGGAEGDPGVATGNLETTIPDIEGFSVFYIDRTAGRSFKMRIDSESPVTITTTGTNEVKEATIMAASRGNHTLKIYDPLGGTAIIGAIGGRGSSGISVLNWGVPGSIVANWHKDTEQYWGSLNFVKGADPDLIFLEIGANDTGITPLVDYQASLEAIIDYCKANTQATIVLCETYDNGGTDSGYIEVARRVAADKEIHILSLMTVMQGSRSAWYASVEDPSHLSQDGQFVWSSAFTEIAVGRVRSVRATPV